MPSRRQIVQAALIGFGGLPLSLRIGSAEPGIIEIEMTGSPRGTDVWFDPVGLRVEPGASIRWINSDRRHSHTATAYHPANGDYPLRIPAKAEPWDSGYLLPGDSFTVTLSQEGIYDYVCLPHELAGMVGRIIVGEPDREVSRQDDEGLLPDAARRAFPAIDDIMRHEAIRHHG